MIMVYQDRVVMGKNLFLPIKILSWDLCLAVGSKKGFTNGISKYLAPTLRFTKSESL